jgi:hypothetical protein
VKFMLFTYRDPSVQLDAEQRATVPAAVAAWCDEMDSRGVRLAGHVLAPISEAQTLRVRQGELAVDDGPVTEQTLQIAGFNILECQDRDEAVEVASKNPGASFGVLELRAIEE